MPTPKKSGAARASKSPSKPPPKVAGRSAQPKLLSGGNPQIAKADGDAPVQAYIAAMPDWKRAVGRRLDALVVRAVPGVRKAMKWNSPFYGVAGQGWFLSYHCFTKYVKVAFLRGTELRPPPPVESKDPNARYYHVHEGDGIDEAQFVDWVRQAAAIPGWDGGSPSSGGLSLARERSESPRRDGERKNAVSKKAESKKADANAVSDAPSSASASQRISERIADLDDWRGKTLARIRKLIRQADPDVVEEWKWNGTPVWSHGGILCTGETYQSVVKLTFARGASLADPARLFNASLEGGTRRAIDIREGETVDAAAFQALVRAAVARNESSPAKSAKKKRS